MLQPEGIPTVHRLPSGSLTETMQKDSSQAAKHQWERSIIFTTVQIYCAKHSKKHLECVKHSLYFYLIF